MRSLAAVLIGGLLVPSAECRTQEQTWSTSAKPSLIVRSENNAGEVLFGPVTGTARLRNGDLAVASDVALTFFDAKGRVLREIGRKGSGPGEYEQIAWMGQCAPDTLVIHDLRQNRLTLLDATGRVLKTIYLRGFPMVRSCGPMASFVFVDRMEARGTGGGVPAIARAWVVKLDLRTEKYIDVAQLPAFENTAMGQNIIPVPLGAMITLAATPTRLWIGAAGSADVVAYSVDGERGGSVTIALERRVPMQANIDAALDERVRFAPGAVGKAYRRQLAALGVPRELPVFSGIIGAGSGALWVQTSFPGDARTKWEIYDMSGRRLKSVEFPRDLRVHEVGEEYLTGVLTASNGTEEVVVIPVSPSPRPGKTVP